MRHWLIFLHATGMAIAAGQPGLRVLEPRRHHLGVAGLAEWSEFETSAPTGIKMDVTFRAAANKRENTLFIWQENVKVTWNVMLNGRKLGALETLAQPLVRALRVPAGAIHDGENRLTIMRTPSPQLDDIRVGEIQLDPRPIDEALNTATLVIQVTDAETGLGLPCRLTLTDAREALAPLQVAAGTPVAARTGVVYTADGTARMGVRAGELILHAGRGFEYSVATEKITVAAGGTRTIALRIRREVPTPGWIASDTHIHTLTFSKHGDATVDERMLTIAGEGIELAVATEHNHHADFSEPAAKTGVARYFRAVVGNEVTTTAGHFNAFPIQPGSAVPDAKLKDWTQLLHNIRTVTGAKVVTLNHPRDVHANFTPLGPANFDAVTGTLKAYAQLDCDAIEVVTSAAMQSDVMQLYRDWFALLNHGYRLAAIGASDTHHVSEFILGQARTYVASGAVDAATIDLDEIWESYRKGRLLVSLGLLAEMTINGRFGVGDLVSPRGADLDVVIDVRGPSWVNADRLELFANGIKVREQAIAPTREPLKAHVRWTLPAPEHDVHLVAIATGPGVTAPYWEIPRSYQPASKTFTPRVVGSTNPIWIDGDGDGEFTCARAQAAKRLQTAADDAATFIASLAAADEAIALQAADLWVEAGYALDDPKLNAALAHAPRVVQAGFSARSRAARVGR